MYLIGRITSTHGIRGELKVDSLSDFERFEPGKIVYIEDRGNYLPFEIESARVHQNRYLVKLIGKDNINDVLMYKGLKLYAKEKSLEPLDDDEYYYDDLIGKQVKTTQGEVIGEIVSIIEVPQGHLIEVEKTNGKKIMIPFVSFFIDSIDDQVVVIKPIEGLL